MALLWHHHLGVQGGGLIWAPLASAGFHAPSVHLAVGHPLKCQAWQQSRVCACAAAAAPLGHPKEVLGLSRCPLSPNPRGEEGGLAGCSPRGHKESGTTELNISRKTSFSAVAHVRAPAAVTAQCGKGCTLIFYLFKRFFCHLSSLKNRRPGRLTVVNETYKRKTYK